MAHIVTFWYNIATKNYIKILSFHSTKIIINNLFIHGNEIMQTMALVEWGEMRKEWNAFCLLFVIIQ